MSGQDPFGYLKALLSKDFESNDYQKSKTKPLHKEPVVITISRDYGALGEEVARELAACLRIPVYDQEILDRVAVLTKTDRLFVEKLDERSQAAISGFLYGLISGSSATMQIYQRALEKVVLELATHDCILVGRGAHLILKGKNVFRLRVVGSREICAARVATAEGLSSAAAEAKVVEVNEQRHKAINALFEQNFKTSTLEHAVNFDLVVNSDRLSAQGAALTALMALEQMGYHLNRAS